MKSRMLCALTLLVLLSGFSLVFGADEKAAAPMNDQQAAMMKKWMEYATPGEAHKAMQNMVGAWDCVVKSWMSPGAPPEESKGTSTYSSLMDGRYVQENVESTFSGMPFHGMGIYGYDNMTKKYHSTWIDSMGTGVMNGEGTSTDGGKTINWTSKASDPMTGKQQSYRSTMKMVSADQYVFEMFGPGPGGKEVKQMEITYTRKK